ncbi:DUF4397 domain-containing protein [Streptomyces alkaliphilus]|uniref:DUF4397 domain-containing protein n=2 Tax=Streptomyces alkaliphilus TaxID=1472722 RepID=A0A7W3TI64_9ACTN|nr:DUF4397 domain-containing protein [Streptomyces alkaliphilus]MBB0247070.1 DUF4397 domain-containing protein [Streptomyces alkaliphilus]
MMKYSRSASFLVAAAGSCALTLGLAIPASADEHGDDTATVSVLHGVPGLTVDVYANGEILLPDFRPGTLTDPLELPAGSYDLAVYEAGADPDEAAPAIEQTVEVPGGANATVAAHLSAGGDPQLTAFVNDTSEIAAGESRLTVRHVAAAPAVDVRAGGTPVFEGLENPNEASADLPAGIVEADVVLAGTDDVVIGPAELDLTEGVSTIVYAWGSAEDGTLDLAVQSIDDLHSAPGGVDAGGSGTMAPMNSTTEAALWGVGTAAALAGVAGLALVRRRSVEQS